jgi:MFS family permease
MRQQQTLEDTRAVTGKVARPRGIALPRTFAALRNRDYLLMWTGTLGSFTAMQMNQIARGFLAYHLTGSAAILGAVMLARGLPQMLFTLFGGVLADRLPKRKLLLATQIGSGTIVLITAILVATDRITVWQLIMLGFVDGSIFAFNMPSRQAILPEVVGPKDLMNAVALNNAGMNFTQVFGPALAGFLIGSVPFIGLRYVFFVMAACYLVPVFMLTQLKPKFVAPPRPPKPVLEELRGGFHYVYRHEVLAMLLVLGLVPIFFGFSYQTLLPVFASAKVLDVGASGLGLMSAATGVGALIGSLAIASFTTIRRRGLMQLATGAAWGLSIAMFALAPHFHFALLALAFVGLSGSAYRSLNTTLITATVDPQYYGRVMSINQLGFSITMLTPLPVGIIVDHIGAPPTVAASGLLITVFVAGVALFVSSYRRLEMHMPVERARARA